MPSKNIPLSSFLAYYSMHKNVGLGAMAVINEGTNEDL